MGGFLDQGGKMVRLMVGLLLCTVGTGGLAQAPRPGAAWYEAGHVLLGITEPGVGLSGSWQFDRAENGDTRVSKDEQRMGTQVKGTVLAICDDHALLLQDLQAPKGPATDELDGPIHMLQLALRLLDRGLPQGPRTLAGEQTMDVIESINPIRVKASNSSTEFLAPWHVRGKVTRIASDQISFDLAYAYTTAAAKGRRFEMSLVGVWHEGTRMPAFANDMSLAGWTVYRIDPAIRTVAGVAVVERRVALQAVRFGTLGELRAHIERGWHPDPRAPRRRECKL